jgi:hypothetical protein
MIQHELFARKINNGLKRGKVEIIDTTGLDSFCDNVSIALDNQVMALLHDENDKNTASLIFDTVIEFNGNKYYIEPYNARLLNVSKI